jgi:hypothetical protein
MSVKLDFGFYIEGLKAAILSLLKNGNPNLSPVQLPMTGVQKFARYAGEFNTTDIMSAVKSLGSDLPAVLVAYHSGKDRQNAATGNLDGEQIEFEHTCGFVVIVVSNNLRKGGAPRITTADKMAGEARQLLGGVQFAVNVAAEGEPEQLELLNHTPLMFVGVETVLLLSDLTALSVSFRTSFKEWTPDRRVVSVGTADEILLNIEINGMDTPPAFNLPGVIGEKQ